MLPRAENPISFAIGVIRVGLRNRMQIANEAIEFAHIFASAFFRFQFALTHHDGQIANVMESLARQFFRSFVPIHRCNAFGEI